VSDPATPDFIGSWVTTGAVHDVVLNGIYLYAADHANGLAILNVSNPELPYLYSTFDTDGYAYALLISQSTLFLADDWQGLAAVYIANPQSPSLLGEYSFPGSVNSVWVSQDYAYVARGATSELSILDISDPENPTEYSEITLTGSGIDTYVMNGICYSSHQTEGVFAIDVNNPGTPTQLSRFNTEGLAVDAQLQTPYLYCADNYGGLLIVNYTHPASPTYVSHTYMSGIAKGIVLQNDTAYVSQWDAGIAVFDVSNVNSPQLIDEFDTRGLANRCILHEGYLFVADGVEGLTIWLDGLQVANYNTEGSVWDVRIAGDLAYLADGTGGLVILDVGNPLVPQYRGSYRTPGVARELFLNGDEIYVANQNSLVIVRYTGTGIESPHEIQLPEDYQLSLFPNPFNSHLSIQAAIPFNNNVDISVYNSSGQRISKLFDGFLPRGVHNFGWNAAEVASGVYYIQINTGQESIAQRVVFEK
ncbi:MAG: T9SS type A sorting domain-containing protein, partial [bacterium]